MKFLFLLFFSFAASEISFPQSAFKVIPLGVKGGSDESNLSCYLLAAWDTSDYVCLDAGTIRAGLQKAIAKKLLSGSAEALLRRNIKGYLLSHGHLDHTAGLVLNSPDDSSKNIYVMPYVKKVLQEKYFTQGSWSNFSDEGEKPIGKYHYVTLDSAKEIPLAGTELFVTPFPLSHGTSSQSTAFLIRFAQNYLLYLGDTGADEIERSANLRNLWQYAAPLVKSRKLKAIFIECSFPDEQPRDQLFGHLTPALLLQEMQVLADAGAGSLAGLPIVITHIKPAGDNEINIKRQLNAGNQLNLKIIYAQQARQLNF